MTHLSYRTGAPRRLHSLGSMAVAALLSLPAAMLCSPVSAQPGAAPASATQAPDQVPRDVRYPVRVAVDADGAVTALDTHDAVPDSLLRIVERAVRRAHFEPAARDGVAVPSRTWVTVRVGFQADNGKFRARVVDVLPGGGVELSLAPRKHPVMMTRARGYSAVVWTRVDFDSRGKVDRRTSGVQRVEVTADPGVRDIAQMRTGLAKRFESRVEDSLGDWRWTPDEVDGTAIGGSFVLPVAFPSSYQLVAHIAGADESPDLRYTAAPGSGLRAAKLQPWRTAAQPD